MLKAVGGLLVVSVTTIIGFCYANAFKEREKNLQYFVSALFVIRKEIGFSVNSLDEIFLNIGSMGLGKVSELFYTMANIIREKLGTGVYKAWEEAREKHDLKLGLDDISLLDTFFKVLGCADRESEICNIDKTANSLESKLTEAKANSIKNMTMYRVVGVTSGIAIVIFLI